MTICRACGCIIIDGQCACTQQALEPLPLGALCSCGACRELSGNEAYAPGGSPLVWGPQYCASCGDAVGEPGSRAALEADAARYRALRDGGLPIHIFEGHPPANVVVSCGPTLREWSTGETLDAALDAAMEGDQDE